MSKVVGLVLDAEGNQIRSKVLSLAPSTSSRWLVCPGSVTAINKFNEDMSNRGLQELAPSEDARDGSIAHEMGGLWLNALKKGQDFDPAQLIGTNSQSFSEHPYKYEMVEFVEVYVNYIKNKILPDVPMHQRIMEVEHKLTYEHLILQGVGRADLTIVDTENRTLHVADLKYGKGQRVYASYNSECLLYAISAVEKYKGLYEFDKVVIHIIQPRMNNIDAWTISMDKLEEWTNYVVAQAEKCYEPNPTRNASEDACRYCKIKGTCPEMMNLAVKSIGLPLNRLGDEKEGDIDMSNTRAIESMTEQELGRALRSKKIILAWLDAVEKVVYNELTERTEYAGFKVVAGRKVRSWKDEGEASAKLVELLGEKEAYSEPKLISPAQAEKCLGTVDKAQITDYIVKSDGKPTLAPIEDPRQSLTLSLSEFDMFDGEDVM